MAESSTVECTGLTEAKAREALKRAVDKDVIRLFKGKWASWYPHPLGVQIRMNGKVMLNGVDVISQEGKWAEAHMPIPAREKRFAQQGNQLLINGEVFYEGEFDSVVPHHQGLLLRRGDEFLLVVFKPDFS